jgi:hypothetical protein
MVFAVLTLALAAFTAAGCGGDDDSGGGGGGSSEGTPKKLGKGEGQVNLIAWGATSKTARPIRTWTGCRTSRSRPAAR